MIFENLNTTALNMTIPKTTPVENKNNAPSKVVIEPIPSPKINTINNSSLLASPCIIPTPNDA